MGTLSLWAYLKVLVIAVFTFQAVYWVTSPLRELGVMPPLRSRISPSGDADDVKAGSSQFAAIYSWCSLRVPPTKIYLVDAGDLDDAEMEAAIRMLPPNVERLSSRLNPDGLPLQDSIHERASREPVDLVVVINSDILLYDDFLDAVEYIASQFDRYLMVGARYDSHPGGEAIPPWEQLSRDWLNSYRAEALKGGHLHTNGGTDYYAWRPGGDPSLATVGGRIPSFTYGRGKADNWIVQMAVNNDVVSVVDASSSVMAIHPAHDYNRARSVLAAGTNDHEDRNSASLEMEEGFRRSGGSSEYSNTSSSYAAATNEWPDFGPVGSVSVEDPEMRGGRIEERSEGGGYVNYWSAHSQGKVWSDLNKHLAYTFGTYINQQGTPLHAPWSLMLCDDARAGSQYLCLRERLRPALCSCEHSPYASKMLTDPTLHQHYVVCGSLFNTITESFPDSTAFESLVRQRSQDGVVILLGFNNGYQDMVMNMVCRLNGLGITNYVIAAFEDEAMAFCREEVLPCFMARNPTEDPTQQEAKAKAKAAALQGTAQPKAEAVRFGTVEFRALTKVKSQQVLRILELGLDVVWSDVDIFWKVNPIPQMVKEMEEMGAQIAIQSNAPEGEDVETGHRRINSGLYYARYSPETLAAFGQIVDHASKSRLSEQPSFYSILCGDDKEYVTSNNMCDNPKISVKTRLLSRTLFPNGAMKGVLKGVTRHSQDDVNIVHFNWIEGHGNKTKRMVDTQMWLLDKHGRCAYEPVVVVTA